MQHKNLENSNLYYTMSSPTSRGALETDLATARDEGRITESINSGVKDRTQGASDLTLFPKES